MQCFSVKVKVVFSENAIEPLILAINDKANHQAIFGKSLQVKTKKKK